MPATRTETSAILKDGTLVDILMIQRAYPRSGEQKDFAKATRVYVDEVGKTILDNLRDRFGRPTKTYKAAVTEALQHVNMTGFKVCWSQRAGCSCGCSPGFILRDADNHVVRHTVEGRPVDVYVKINKGALGESKSREL
jgi:hypothetical protein